MYYFQFSSFNFSQKMEPRYVDYLFNTTLSLHIEGHSCFLSFSRIFLCFSSLPGVCWWARVSSHIEILQCLHSGARGHWAPTSLETGERLRLSASLRLSLVSSLSLPSLPGYGTGPTQYLLLINFNWNPQMKYCPIQQLPGTDHFNTARHTRSCLLLVEIIQSIFSRIKLLALSWCSIHI